MATFGLFNQNHGLPSVIEQGGMICFAAKWLGQKKVHFYSTHHDGAVPMIEAVHRLLCEADVVIGYNSNSFDLKHINAEILMHCPELGPPSPYQTIDLLRVIKSRTRFLSHKLENISRRLSLEGKLQHTGMQMWLDCREGDEKAWRLMRKYNIQDVHLTERLYEGIKAWVPNHPNRNLYSDGSVHVCPACGSHDLMKRGYRRTAVSVFQVFQCHACMGYSSSTKRDRGVTLRSA